MTDASFQIRTFPELFYNLSNAETVWHLPGIFRSHSCKFRQLNRLRRHIAENLALISAPYLEQNEVSGPVPISGRQTSGIRPEKYNRAAIIPLGDAFFEVKGCGVPIGHTPVKAPYKDGLFHIHNAVYEVFCERFVHHAIDARRDISTQGSLALIRLPVEFDLGVTHSVKVPAAIYVREPGFAFSIDELQGVPNIKSTPLNQIAIEMDLRSKGLTSCSPYHRLRICGSNDSMSVYRGNRLLSGSEKSTAIAIARDAKLEPPVSIDIINLQMAYSPFKEAIFIKDFEHFHSMEAFEHAVIAISMKQSQIIQPNSKGFMHSPTSMQVANEMIRYSKIRHFIEELSECSEYITTTPVHYYVLKHCRDSCLSGHIKELITVATTGKLSKRLLEFMREFQAARV